MNRPSAKPASSAAAPRVWTPLDLIQWTAKFFEKKGVDAPRLQAELLLAEALGWTRVQIYTRFEEPVPEGPLARFRDFVARRGDKREPLQYILGHTDFVGLEIRVTPAVLIPRPETEELAVAAAAFLAARGPGEGAGAGEGEGETASPRGTQALDLGTGSGCLALALAKKCPAARVTAVDCSDEALAVARENAAALELAERVEFLGGDLFAPLNDALRGGFDCIVSNPPYIDPALRETLQPEVRDFEPAGALFCDEQGYAAVRRIIEGAADWLAPGGGLFVELSPEQAERARGGIEATGAFASSETRKDARGLLRFVHAIRK